MGLEPLVATMKVTANVITTTAPVDNPKMSRSDALSPVKHMYVK